MWVFHLAKNIAGKLLDCIENIDEFQCPEEKIKEADFQRLISEMAFRQAQCDEDVQFIFHIVPGVVQVYQNQNAMCWNDLYGNGLLHLQQICQFHEWPFCDSRQFIDCRKKFYRHYDDEDREIVIHLAHDFCTVFSAKEPKPKQSFHRALDQALGQRHLENINHFKLAKSCWTCRKFKRFVKKTAGIAGKVEEAITFLLDLIPYLMRITRFGKRTVLDVLKWIFSAGKALAKWIGNKFLENAFSIFLAFCDNWKSTAQQIVKILAGFWSENNANDLCSFYAKIGAWLGGKLAGPESELSGEHIGVFVGPFLFTFISDKIGSWLAGKTSEKVFEEWKWEEKPEAEKKRKEEKKPEEERSKSRKEGPKAKKSRKKREQKKRQRKKKQEEEKKQEEGKRQKLEEKPEEEGDERGGGPFDHVIATIAGWTKLLAKAVCFGLFMISVVLILKLL